MLGIISDQGNANQNSKEVSLHTHLNDQSEKKDTMTNIVQMWEPSDIAGGYVKWCRHFGKLHLFEWLDSQSPYTPAVPPLGKHPKRMRMYVHTETFTWLYVVTFSQ